MILHMILYLDYTTHGLGDTLDVPTQPSMKRLWWPQSYNDHRVNPCTQAKFRNKTLLNLASKQPLTVAIVKSDVLQTQQFTCYGKPGNFCVINLCKKFRVKQFSYHQTACIHKAHMRAWTRP